jgi:acyl-CoA oxidase
VNFWRLSTAHAQYLIVKSFHGALNDPKTADALDKDTLTLMHKLFRLYALHTMERESSEFYLSAACTVRQIQLARTTTVMKLMEEIRPHAIRLVDAWKFPDWQLDSSLGRYDGKVYEDMFHRASELNPLNSVTFDPYPDSKTLFKKDERENLRSKL